MTALIVWHGLVLVDERAEDFVELLHDAGAILLRR